MSLPIANKIQGKSIFTLGQWQMFLALDRGLPTPGGTNG